MMRILPILLVVMPVRQQLAAQDTPSATASPVTSHEVTLRWRPRVSTSSVEDAEATRWELERMRLQARLELWRRLSGRVQVDYDAGEWSVEDAWVRLRLRGETNLLLGQAKRPFTVLSMRSGSRVGTVSRGASIRGVDAADEQNLVSDLAFGDRAVGVQIAGPLPFAPPGMRIQAGWFPAEGFREPLRIGGGQASVRLTAQVAPRVVLGTAASTRRSGDDREDAPPPGTAVAFDVEVGDDEPGLHLLAEAVAGRVREVPEGGFRGAHLWLMYRTAVLTPARLTFEPVARVSTSGGAFADAAGSGTLLTPGLNVFIGDPENWNRLLINYDLWRPRDGGPWARSLKLQLQIGI
jgi:hypothetical protein